MELIDRTSKFLSHTVSIEQLKPGDHIYVHRKPFFYTHHGIFVGQDDIEGIPCPHVVAHFGNKQGGLTNWQSLTIVKCTLSQFLSGAVSDTIVHNKSTTIKRALYNVSRLELALKWPGTCYMEQPDEPSVVVQRALSAVGKCNGSYNLAAMNCELFARYCKVGPSCLLTHSDQYSRFSSFPLELSASVIGATAGVIIGGAVGPNGSIILGAVLGIQCGKTANILAKHYLERRRRRHLFANQLQIMGTTEEEQQQQERHKEKSK